jgi:HEAT repeat protein
MNAFDWKTFLQQWSADLLASSWASELPQDIRTSGWLGFAAATENELAEVEARLKLPLPPSYRSFLRTSNGWRRTGHAIERLRPAHQLKWFRHENKDWIAAYTRPATGEETTPDAEYFAYTTPQEFRPQHLRETLQISDVGDAAVYLLNPQVIDKTGEWEAWFFANWLPGVHRYRSFLEMMLAEYNHFAGIDWKQPVGLLDELPDEYVGSPGSPKRKKRIRRRTREPKVLGRRLADWTVDELVEMLAVDAWQVQTDAADALGRLGKPAAVEPLLALAKADANHASVVALHAAFKLAPNRTRDLLLDAIRNRSPLTFYVAAKLSAELHDTRALPLLTEILRDADPGAMHLTECVGQCIAEFGEDGLQTLAKLVASDAPHIRRRAAQGLIYTNNPKAGDALRPLLNDPDPQVRETAEIALKVLPPPRTGR